MGSPVLSGTVLAHVVPTRLDLARKLLPHIWTQGGGPKPTADWTCTVTYREAWLTAAGLRRPRLEQAQAVQQDERGNG